MCEPIKLEETESVKPKASRLANQASSLLSLPPTSAMTDLLAELTLAVSVDPHHS